MEQAKKEMFFEAVKGLLEDEKKPVQHTAVRVLSLFPETQEISIPLLIDTVVDGDKQAKGRAIETLIAVGEAAVEPVIEGLIGNEDDQDARLCGLHVLSEIFLHDAVSGEAECCGPKKANDPHGLGPIFREVLVDVLREALAGESTES